MRKIIFLLTIILIFFTAANSFAFVTKGQDCSKCHNLKKDALVMGDKNAKHKVISKVDKKKELRKCVTGF